MAASRLTDDQKQELVGRYRAGETAQSLATVYGCSPNTVSRVLKALLDPGEMDAIKKQSRGRSATVVANPEADPAGDPSPPEAEDPAAMLAIDDADDFSEDGLDAGGDDDEDSDEHETFVTVTPAATVSPRPLHSDSLPPSVYLLVDKTVELEARPLRDFSELGGLPEEEQDRQALMLYTNPRQAKRQCGRTQRVIKVPDSGVLERTSRYLVAQGITRLVLEGGSLFAIPGT